MAFQTSMTQNPAVAVAGMIADSTDALEIVTGQLTTGTPEPGTFVARVAGQDAYARPSDATTVGKGGGFLKQITDREGTNYAAPCVVPVVRHGRIWVQVDAAETLSRGDDVFIAHANGKIRNDNTGATQLAGAKVERFDSTLMLALVDLG